MFGVIKYTFNRFTMHWMYVEKNRNTEKEEFAIEINICSVDIRYVQRK